MKKIFSCVLIFACFTSFLTAKPKKSKSENKESVETTITLEKETSDSSGKYYKDGYSGEVTTLVILEPEGQNLTKENEWLLSFIQTQLIDNFTACSPIIISDRQNADKAQNEIGLQENGMFDESAIGATFGEAVGASYMLTGQLIDTGTSFTLSLRINDITKNITITSVKKTQFGAAAIKNGSIINQATEELLKELGVELTSAGREKLYGVDEQTLKQQESLSKGINASKRGTVVEAMQYYYAAAEYSVDNTEVYSRLNALQTAVSTGNLGDMARNEDEVYDYWKKTLTEAEAFFAERPPYEIIYSTDLKRLERTRAELENKENSVAIRIGLITSNSAKNTISTLRRGINDSPDVVRKVLRDWPEISVGSYQNTWIYPDNYVVTVQLINSLDKVISTAQVNLDLVGPGILETRNIELYQLDYLNDLTFRNVKSSDLTDDLTIKVTEVICAGKYIPTDLIRISTVEGFKEPMLLEERLELERQAEIRRLERIEADRKAREEQRAEVKDKVVNGIKDYLKRNRRKTFYLSFEDKFNDYNNAYGARFGIDRPIFSHLYYGINGFVGKDDFDYRTWDCQFLLGLNFYNKQRTNALFGNVGMGYLSNGINGEGFLLSSTIGYDWKALELSYTLQFVPFYGYFADGFDVGLVFKLGE